MKKTVASVIVVLLLCVSCMMEPHEHTYSSTWTYDAQYHWHAATCEHTDEVSDKAPHSWDEGKTVAATCTKAGTITFTCTVCGATRTETIPATGHKWNDGEVTTEPTCTTEGIKTFTCSNCNKTRTETIPSTEHSWEENLTMEASCTEDGKITKTCTICGSVNMEIIPAYGHVWNEGETITPSSCSNSGVKKYTCLICGYEEIQYLPKDYDAHTYSEWSFIQDSRGQLVQYRHCIDCGIKEELEEKDFIQYFRITSSGCIYVNRNNLPLPSSVIIPSEINGVTVTSIGRDAFNDCSGLTSITIPNSVTSIGSDAFYRCSGLTSITIPNSVTSIGYNAFYGCSGLTDVYVSDLSSWCNILFDGSSSNPMCYAKNLYVNGELLTSLTIPDSVTSIGRDAFNGCSGAIIFEDGITSIPSDAFNASQITSVTIPNSVTSIGRDAFYGCSCAVIFEDGITSIPSNALYNASQITSVTIPNSVTSIGGYAFRGCSGLTSIIIPNSVTSIGYNAFYGCSALTSITFQGTKIQWGSISKGSSWENNVPSSCVVHCTDGDVSI